MAIIFSLFIILSGQGWPKSV